MPLAGRDVISSQRTSLQTLFQSTRPARGATSPEASPLITPTISIHAPREGRDPAGSLEWAPYKVFQSTRPARGATNAGNWIITDEGFQSTRPARGATDKLAKSFRGVFISIHAPREGRDLFNRLVDS